MCSIVLASPSSLPTRIIFGARMIWLADCVTSSDIVAEKSSVCRAAGRDATMRRTLGQESHVEHAIGLVEHQHFESLEIGRVGPHVIQQTAGRRDDDIGSASQAALLRTGLDAAIDGDAGQIRVIREPLEFVFDLDRQLAGRCKDQHARRP